MTQDPRLKGGGFGQLTRLLADALGDEVAVRQVAERLGIRFTPIAHGMTLDQYCHELISSVKDSKRVSIYDLVEDVADALGEDSKKGAAVRLWWQRGSRTESFEEALDVCARATFILRDTLDPRMVRDEVVALRSGLTDILEELETGSIRAVDIRIDAVQLTAAARRSLAQAKRLELGLSMATEAIGRIGASVTKATAFEAEYSIVGQLVDVAAMVEADVSELLRMAGRRTDTADGSFRG